MTFNATQRCDRCGAQAYASALFAAEVLLFCAHHFRKHKDVLLATAELVHDETGALYEQVHKAKSEGVS